jgi:3-deoxy-7-phosphoheptulonate synthase
VLNRRLIPSLQEIQKVSFVDPGFIEQVRQQRDRFQTTIQSGGKVIFVGPCSISDIDEDYKLAEKIKELSIKYPKYMFVFRGYFEKPRTLHFWRGYITDPRFDSSYDVLQGIVDARAFLTRLASLKLAVSYEFLDPFLAPYVQDLITVGFIGARTVYSQTHRQLAASLEMPVVFKNSLDGSYEGAVDAVEMVKSPMLVPRLTKEGLEGSIVCNPNTHVMLRGGKKNPNFDLLSQLDTDLKKRGLSAKSFIDCAHQNCQKNTKLQQELFSRLLKEDSPVCSGLMVECNQFEGNQPFCKNFRKGLSITDPCISIDQFAETLGSI